MSASAGSEFSDGSAPKAGPGRAGRDWADPAFSGLAKACGIVVLVLIGGIIVVMLSGGRLAFTTFGLGFLTSAEWNPVRDVYGALTPIFGTIVTSVIGLVVAVPLAFGRAGWPARSAPRSNCWRRCRRSSSACGASSSSCRSWRGTSSRR
jgi:phosphate transport system permease protein